MDDSDALAGSRDRWLGGASGVDAGTESAPSSFWVPGST
jgi:hypothetical protein